MPNVIKYQFDSDPQKALAGMGKMIAKQEESIQKLKEMNRQGKKAGGEMVGRAASLVTQWLSVGGAISSARAALQQYQQQSAQAAQKRLSKEDVLKKLIQISGGDEKKYNAFVRTGETLSKDYGIEEVQALIDVFTGASLGLSNKQIVKVGGWKKFVSKITPLVEGSAGIATQFGEAALGGTHAGRINAGLAGAEFSKVGVEELMANVLAPGQSVLKLGGTPAELFAAVSVFAKGLKSVEEAATVVGRYADVVTRDKRFKGVGYIESLEMLSRMSESERKAVIGENVRAEKGMGLGLQNLEVLKDLVDEINRSVAATGTPTSRINLAKDLSDKVLGPMTAQQRTKASRGIAEEKVMGLPQLRREAMRDTVMEAATTNKLNVFARWVLEKEFGFHMATGTDPEVMARQYGTTLTHQRGEEMTRENIARNIDELVRLGRERNDQVRISGEPLE